MAGYLYPKVWAIIFFLIVFKSANAQTIDADTGLDILLAALKKQYGL